MGKPIFPIDPKKRASEFAAAERYFAENPDEAKMRRNRWLPDGANSFIKADDGKIYMLARDNYLGKGSFGNVKLAIDKDGNEVAIKVEAVKQANKQYSDAEIGSGKEAGLVYGAVSRQSESSKGTGEEGEQQASTKVYQVQHKAGVPLSSFMLENKTQLSSDERMRIAMRVTKVIAALHHKDIAHRDIKPDNLLINPVTHEVTVIDFGFAEKKINRNPTFQAGSAPYMPPDSLTRNLRTNDIHAVVKTIFFPGLADNESHAVKSARTVLTLSSNKELIDTMKNTSVLLATDLSKSDGLYSRQNDRDQNVFLTTIDTFKSCEDLAIEVISKKYGVDIKLENKDKLKFLEAYDHAVTAAIHAGTPLSKSDVEQVVAAVTQPAADTKASPVVDRVKDVVKGIEHFQKASAKLSGIFDRKEDAHKANNYVAMLSNASLDGFQKLVVISALLTTENFALRNAVVSSLGCRNIQEAKVLVAEQLRNAVVGQMMQNEGLASPEKIVQAMLKISASATAIDKAASQKNADMKPLLAGVKALHNGLTTIAPTNDQEDDSREAPQFHGRRFL